MIHNGDFQSEKSKNVYPAFFRGENKTAQRPKSLLLSKTVSVGFYFLASKLKEGTL